MVDVREWQRFEKGSECAPDEPLGWFERLLADLSATFINAPSEQVNGILQDALGRVADSLNLDRSTLWAAEDGDLVRSHDWTRPGFRRRVWLAAPARVSARELLPWSLEKANAGELVKFSSVDEVPNEVDRASYRRFGTKSVVAVPLRVGGRSLGVVAFSAVDAERSWPSANVSRLQLVASAFADLLARRQSDESLRTALAQVSQLNGELQAKHVSLRKEMREQNATGVGISASPGVRRIEEQVQQVAATDSTVLLLGETGSGKEMFATLVHQMSSRRGRAMVRVNCAAIPATLIESELFGREKGAYTGALARQMGRFEMADHSTIFLDEIGDLPLEVQVKLLRVLEEKQSSVWAARSRFVWTPGLLRRPTGISSSGLRKVHFARICTTGSASSRSTCRRSASAWKTYRVSSGNSSRSLRRRLASASTRSKNTTWRPCSSTRGRGTSASSGTWSSGR